MKKHYVPIIMLIAIASMIIATVVIFYFQVLSKFGPPRGEGNRAKDALERSIAAISSGNEVNDLIITTTRWYKLSEFSEDFVSAHSITWRDYTFGAWEFNVEFPEVEKEYYFDLSYSPDTSKWRVFIKPVGKCLKPRFQISCLLPEYRQVRRETLHGLHGVQLTSWYEADPNAVVDKDDIRSRIMNALSEDGWQPISLPEDQNSISNKYEIGPDDLYYSLKPSTNDDNPYVQRIHISEDAKTIVLYFGSMFIWHKDIGKANNEH